MRLAPKVKARYDNTPEPTILHLPPTASDGTYVHPPVNCENCHTPLGNRAVVAGNGRWVHRGGCPTKPKAET